MNKEYRNINAEFNEESRTVSGYAIVFDSASEDLGFTEIINRSAVTEELIANSDVFAKLNHNDDKVLARSNKGVGSLRLTIDERGLKYEFEAPHTQYGEELLEHLRRGEITSSSFAFTVDRNDKEAERWLRSKEGKLKREIYKISGLYDVSPVFTPAYSSTSCDLRAINEALDKEEANLNEELNKIVDEGLNQIVENIVEKVIEDVKCNETSDTDATEDPKTEKEPLESPENLDNESNVPENEEQRALESEKENLVVKNVVVEDSKEVKENNKFIDCKMEKRFKLISAVKNLVDGRSMDDVTEAVVNAGKEEMRHAGISSTAQISLPTQELRANEITVAAEGADVVATDLYDVLEPLRANSVLVSAGAKFITGLVGDVQYPVMSAGNVGWEDEIDPAKAFGTTFTNVKLSPKRLTAFIDISKQMLAQDSANVEAAIRRDIVNAIADKLQATILGTGAGSTSEPKGLFNGTIPTVASYKDLLDLEAAVEDANIYGKGVYLVSNKAKADLRNMAKSSKIVSLVMENGTIDGTPVYNTSSVAGKGIAYGDFSNLVIGQWGGIDLTVDSYTQAVNGMVRLVINAYFDAQVLRPNAIKVASL